MNRKLLLLLALLATGSVQGAQQHIDFGGPGPNDGDTAPVAFGKIEANTTELYATVDILTADLSSLTTLVGTKQDGDADLTAIAGLTPTNDDVLQRKAGAWINRSLAQLRSDLALVIGTNVQAWDADLDIWAGKTAPTGAVVGTSDTQTLTNKSISGGQITSAVANATSAVSATSAGTAAALSADGTDCSIGDASRGIDAAGNATGCFTPAASGAPTDATYITQTANGSLSNEQAMGALATGLVKNTTTTGVQSIAVQGTDYYAPGGTDVAVADGGTGASTATGARTNLDVQQHDTDLDAWAGKTAPSGDAVGTTDSQTLTNKTLSGAVNTITNISLTTGVTGVLPAANGGATAPNIQEFTASGTWTKPSGAAYVRVIVIGPGGGGGGGARVASGTSASGGGGGGGGYRVEGQFLASDLTGTVAITIGTGGAGGAGATSDGVAGSNGVGGSAASQFGTYLYAFPGGRGGGGGVNTTSGGGGSGGTATAGGNASGATAGAAGVAGGSAGGAGIAAAASGGGGGANGGTGTGGLTTGVPAGGVSGGGITTGCTGFTPSSVGRVLNWTDSTVPTPGNFGGAGGTGGVGSASSTTSGGNALRGAGGGGGGSGCGVNGAAGGTGGDGYVLVVSFF